MCGISGLVNIHSHKPVDRELLKRMNDALRHRGPDDAGVWVSPEGHVGLAHRRLSIIDLSERGHQPMTYSGGRFWISFNGEIYNYKDLRSELIKLGHVFQSDSDTEVVLAAYDAWGTKCLERLNGMFAFALYDSPRRQLFMARDRAGEKPLYYALEHGKVRFASELKALMVDTTFPRYIDLDALDCYLAMGFVPGERCILKGVKKLPPAHALVFDLQTGQARLWRYWQLPMLDVAAEAGLADEDSLLEELDALLEDSVRRQLVADVPVGVLLSGGVDSSLVTAMAVRATPKIKTFTIRFPGFGNYDESKHAQLVARHFGTEHLELEATESTVDLLPVLVRQFDEPMVDSSMIPTYLISRMIRQHCTVALGGDGGDELFGGYHHYRRLLWYQQVLGQIPLSLRQNMALAAEVLLPVGFKGRNWLQGLGVDLQWGLPLIASFFDPRTRRALAGRDTWAFVAETIREQRIPRTSDLLQRATRMDFENYLAEDILVKVDRVSMLNSLEVRAPLLDYRLVEFAFGKVPSPLKATATSSKVLLKKLTARLLPPGFDQHRKQGFSIPLGAWLRSGPWQRFFREVLLDSDNTFFNRKAMSKLLNGQTQGLANGERLFALVLFELWRKEYRIGL